MGDMESLNPEFTLYDRQKLCARTDAAFFPTASYIIWLLWLFLPSTTLSCKLLLQVQRQTALRKEYQFLIGSLGDNLCKPFVPKLHVYHAGDA